MNIKSTQTILIITPIILSLITFALRWILPDSLMVTVILPLGVFLSLIVLIFATPKFIADNLRSRQTLKWFRLFRGLFFLTLLINISLDLSLMVGSAIEFYILPLGSTINILLPVVIMQHVASVLYFAFIFGMIYAIVFKKEYREYKFNWLDIIVVLILVLFSADHINELVTPHPFFFEDYGI